MKNSLLISILILLFIGIVSGCIGETAPPTPTEFGNLKGHVYWVPLDSDEESPLEGATVILKDTSYTTTTDDEGFFEILNIGVGKYTLIVEKKGFEEFSEDIEIKKDETLDLSGDNKIVLRPLRDEYLFNKGMELYKEKDYVGAVFYFSELKDDFPDSEYIDKALYYLGMSYYELGLFNDAIYNFEELTIDYPESEYTDDALFKLGDTYYAWGNYDKAIYYYKKLIEEFPESKYLEKAMYSLAKSYMDTGDEEDALDALNAFVDKFPESEYADDATYFIGYIYYKKGEYRDAIAIWEKIPEEYSIGTWPDGSPILASVYFYLGEAYRKLEEFDKAKEYYEDVIKEFPDAQFNDGSLISDYAKERLEELNS